MPHTGSRAMGTLAIMRSRRFAFGDGSGCIAMVPSEQKDPTGLI